jgi:hypothetical protein
MLFESVCCLLQENASRRLGHAMKQRAVNGPPHHAKGRFVLQAEGQLSTRWTQPGRVETAVERREETLVAMYANPERQRGNHLCGLRLAEHQIRRSPESAPANLQTDVDQ